MEKVKLISEKINPLFTRKELIFVVRSDVSPKIKEVEEFIGKEYSVNPENVKVKIVKGNFGSNNFTITANIYNSKEEKDKVEVKAKKEKKKGAAVKK